MKKLKKGIAVSLMFAMCATAMVGCGGNDDKQAQQTPAGNDGDQAPAAEVIKIGGLSPLTGDLAVYGTSNTNAANMAFKEINAAGGINGAEIAFDTQDEKGDPTEAINAYNKLVDSGVVAILGDVTSAPCAAVAEQSVADNMPCITATGTASNITTYGDNYFRVCFTDPLQGKTMATFAAENLEAKTAAVLYNVSSDYSDGLAQAFLAQAEVKGLTIVATETFSDADKDFKAQLTKISGLAPDVLFVPEYYSKVSLIANQAKEVGCEAVLLGADGWDGVMETLDASAVDVVEGAYFCNHYSADDQSDKVQNFIANYKAAYNETPNAFAALGYDAAYILADAIERAGSTDSQAIIDALASTEYEGVTGKITFDEVGDPVKSLTIIKIVEGQYTFDTTVLAD